MFDQRSRPYIITDILLIREIGLVDCNVAVLKEKRAKGSCTLRVLLIRIFHYHSPHDEVRILNVY